MIEEKLVRPQLDKMVMELKRLQEDFFNSSIPGEIGELGKIQLKLNARRFVMEAQILETMIGL